MFITVYSAKCIGIEAVGVSVETHVDLGIGIHLVGLADVAVKESLLRTMTALVTLGYRIAGKRIVINMAPADLRKNGSLYDVPIAVSIVAATGQMELPNIEKYLILGELGLDGSIRAIPGALPCTEFAKRNGFEGIILPEESALEAVDFKDFNVFGVASLKDVLSILAGDDMLSDYLIWNSRAYRVKRRAAVRETETELQVDFSDIIGQEGAKRGLEIAAAGGHNVLLVGAPGSGKSSLAKALPGIMPPLTSEEALVTSKIFSVSGKPGSSFGLMRKRPFRAPHCSATLSALVGGGSGDSIVPGEVSLANGGVLFLDEFGQMPKSVIEALRAPLEDREVTISRLRGNVTFPASFMLVAASNPCPCGYWGEADRCKCTPSQRLNYLSKLSGPLLDRIDVHCWMHCVPPDTIARYRQSGKTGIETSEMVAARVLKARIAQKHRFASDSISVNAEMGNRQIEKYCQLSTQCRETLSSIMESRKLSMRAYFRIIKVARTIADLAGSPDIMPVHIIEASGFRILDGPEPVE